MPSTLAWPTNQAAVAHEAPETETVLPDVDG
ncbi:MAG: hypothetical protein QOE89_2346, partial [Pseudonocardiales bacterium]|nr:hypothetical protein [Pseudonocardiales bacterium]